jgi:glucose/arabinose dehydrogenase
MLRLVLCAWLLAAGGTATAATLPAQFVESTLASGLQNPTAMAFAPDGRLFITEQSGRVRVVSGGVLRSTPFVTLTVNSSGERGLLGVAFDPEFESNQFVYLYYTATMPTIHNRVSRFTANGNVALAGSEVVILDLETLGATNHNGGAIHFGNDGTLFIAVGDNAIGSNAQSLGTRLGKILRVNADGTIPADNPFFETANGNNRAIWARGLRNPFTFSFQRGTATMFINDVGQNTWEEINRGRAGANYGWPATEGETTDPRFVSPVHAYDHGEGCAITGGAFYNPQTAQFPAAYTSSYFFADFCGGWIRRRAADGNVTGFATGIPSPVDLQVGADGSLYYLARGSGSTTGVVRRVAFTGPRVMLTANGEEGPVVLAASDPLTVSLTFDTGNASTVDPAEVYVGVATLVGTFWLDPATRTFLPTPTRLFTGALADFGPIDLVNVASVSGLSGPYWWFTLVDADANGVPNGTFADVVLTVVPRP